VGVSDFRPDRCDAPKKTALKPAAKRLRRLDCINGPVSEPVFTMTIPPDPKPESSPCGIGIIADQSQNQAAMKPAAALSPSSIVTYIISPIDADYTGPCSAARNDAVGAGVGARAPAGTSLASSPPLPGHHHVYITAAALRANQPASPFRHWRLWPIPAGLLGRVRFAPVTTCFAPDHKPDVGRGGTSECHGWAAVGFHRCGTYSI